MYRENYIKSLHSELIALVEQYLSPIAIKYGYSQAPLEANIKWRPLVLILGNYSSGKSTLINEYLGEKIQATGQAPTDDSFTVITYGKPDAPLDRVKVVDERDGKFLLNDPEYPFTILKRHGERFTAHFRLKKVNSPFLKNLAIIDTPGMLDSITERDRGYNYQEVIGDLAQISDLVLVLFDPHKAGTVREAYTSLRDTLPSKTFEDRVRFVLNRIDECTSMIDLLKVYGTLCWNLSQMTGRKDIPPIRLTYSSLAHHNKQTGDEEKNGGYLKYLDNQREDLKEEILEAPRHRLDHLATFVETHSGRLTHLIEALIGYKKNLRQFKIKSTAIGFFSGLLAGGISVTGLLAGGIGLDPYTMAIAGAGIAVLWMIIFHSFIFDRLKQAFNRNSLKQIDQLTPLDNQTRIDTWEAIKNTIVGFIQKTKGDFSLKQMKREYKDVKFVFNEGSKDIREALNEISTLKKDQAFDVSSDSPVLSRILKFEPMELDE
ncbi:MAG: dynamin family protein [Proteobacteria bacterium]|nr:dynamin family protein [Pseudomonadota bacterium]